MTESVPAQAYEKTDGFIGKRLRFLVNMIFWIVMALFFSVLIEILGIFFRWWNLPGALHANAILATELGWLNKDFNSVLGSPLTSSLRFSRTMYEVFFIWFERDLAQSLFTLQGINFNFPIYTKTSCNLTKQDIRR